MENCYAAQLNPNDIIYEEDGYPWTVKKIIKIIDGNIHLVVYNDYSPDPKNWSEGRNGEKSGKYVVFPVELELCVDRSE